MRPVVPAIAFLFCAFSSLNAQAPLPRITTNDNRTTAGTLKAGVLTLNLDVTRGIVVS